MRINNDVYRAAHGRNPRGNGYWFFEIIGIDKTGNPIVETILRTGNFNSAREWACELFTRLHESSSITEVITKL